MDRTTIPLSEKQRKYLNFLLKICDETSDLHNPEIHFALGDYEIKRIKLMVKYNQYDLIDVCLLDDIRERHGDEILTHWKKEI